MKFSYTGKIHLIIGPMYSGKTTELIRQYNRYSIAGKKCIMVKYRNDQRYNPKMVVTHDNIKVDALTCLYLYEVDKLVQGYDVICIDEIQFYKDGDIFCDKWANQGKIVIACGLNGSYQRTPFPIISNLLPLVENITYSKSVCRETGNDAIYSKLNNIPKNGNLEVIGGLEKYKAADRKTYFMNNPDCGKLIEFIRIYLEENKLREHPKLPINQFVKKFNGPDYVRIVKEYILQMKKIDSNNE
jgi:thymidine kinase